MRRRDFIRLLGGAAAWSQVAHAQGVSAPVIGYLSSALRDPTTYVASAFRKGLNESGFVEGRDFAIEYRFAEGHYDRCAELAADLVRRRVAVIVATGSTAPAVAAKAATADIPIVFVAGGDPVAAGLVASLNRPGSNVTGITVIFSKLVPKRLELLHQLAPGAAAIGALLNPSYPEADLQRQELEEAAQAIKRQIHVVTAATPDEIGMAFAALVERRTDALLVANDPFFESQREQIAALAARVAVPAIYSGRSYVEAGGLISYGPDLTEAFRQAGIYAGRILKGAKPADLPVMQPTKFELLINLKTAKALALDIPPALLARADEVIE